MAKIDTLRLLVDWKCNLKCTYCCNEQTRFRKDILPINSLDGLDWDKYKFVCISGGEPLLFMDRIHEVCKRSKGFNIIYSNGLLWQPHIAKQLYEWGVIAANIGLHYPRQFDRVIAKVVDSAAETGIVVRFHAHDKYEQALTKQYKNIPITFRFWKMDDCDRDNEERFVLV